VESADDFNRTFVFYKIIPLRTQL